MVNLMSLWK